MFVRQSWRTNPYSPRRNSSLRTGRRLELPEGHGNNPIFGAVFVVLFRPHELVGVMETLEEQLAPSFYRETRGAMDRVIK